MIKKSLMTVGAILLVLSMTPIFTSAQETQQDQQAMMEAYMKMMAPNENHEYFKSFVGEWDVTTTSWMMPGAEPTVTQNSSKAELIMGGRFLKMAFEGTMMGMPFEGIQIIGYDNLQKKYISFWIDNSSTNFFLLSGMLDDSGKVMTEKGEWPDPMTGGTSKVKTTTKWIGPDEFVYEMFMIGPDGKEFKNLQNQMKRKQ
jgi:hypothetical protein